MTLSRLQALCNSEPDLRYPFITMLDEDTGEVTNPPYIAYEKFQKLACCAKIMEKVISEKDASIRADGHFQPNIFSDALRKVDSILSSDEEDK